MGKGSQTSPQDEYLKNTEAKGLQAKLQAGIQAAAHGKIRQDISFGDK